MAFFEAQNKVPIFIETVSHFVSKEKNWMGSGPHTAVEVLPIELDRLSEAKVCPDAEAVFSRGTSLC